MLHDAPLADLLFTCPPYGDLEVYSDDKRDLSAMTWPQFVRVYREIVLRSTDRLRDNSWACVVVGNYRSKGDDALRDLVGTTVAAFEACGLEYHNEAVLVTPVGTARMRASAQFDVKRKLCRTHQTMLTFVKGDARKATQRVLDSETIDNGVFA